MDIMMGEKMSRIMLSLLILGIVFSITACDSLGFLQSTPSPAEREAEEYAVYNEFLNTKQAENKYKSTVRLLVFRI